MGVCGSNGGKRHVKREANHSEINSTKEINSIRQTNTINNNIISAPSNNTVNGSVQEKLKQGPIINENVDQPSLSSMFQMNTKETFRSFYFTNLESNAKSYSTGSEYKDIIINNKTNGNELTSSLLQGEERAWYEDLMIISNELSKTPTSRNEEFMNKYGHSLVEIYEQFNWIVFALCNYYKSNGLNSCNKEEINTSKYNLPKATSMEWIKGFAWKGLFIRIQSMEKSKDGRNEMKSLNYCGFDYIQIIGEVNGDNVNSNNGNNNGGNGLSNHGLFPFLGYGEVNSLVGFVTVIIKNKLLWGHEINKNHNLIDLNNTSNQVPNENSFYEWVDTESSEPLDIYNGNTIISNKVTSLYNNDGFHESQILSKINDDSLISIYASPVTPIKQIGCNTFKLLPSLYKLPKANKINVLSESISHGKAFKRISFIQSNSSSPTLYDLINSEMSYSHTEKSKSYTSTVNGVDFKLGYLPSNTNESNLPHMSGLDCILNNHIYQTDSFSSSGRFTRITPTVQRILLYDLHTDLKLKYSLGTCYDKETPLMNSSQYFLKANYITHFDSWCRMHEHEDLGISSIKALKANMHRFGINSSLSVFAMINIEKYNSDISDLIKVNLLCTLIKNFYCCNEGFTGLYKGLVYDKNKNGNVLHDPGLRCGNNIRNNNIEQLQKEKLVIIIKMGLCECSLSYQKYNELFINQLGFFLHIKILKWEGIDESLGLDLFKDENIKNRLAPRNFILELFAGVKQKPFGLLSSLEEKLHFQIDPYIKYLFSISLDSVKAQRLNAENILFNKPKIVSYLKTDEINAYLLAKSIVINTKNISFSDSYLKESGNFSKNNTNSVFAQGNSSTECIRNSKNVNASTIVNGEINPNNTRNNDNNDNEISGKRHLDGKEISLVGNLILPPIVYKQKYNFNNKIQNKDKRLYKNLNNKYSIHNYLTVQEWTRSSSAVFTNVPSCSSEVENQILFGDIIEFIHAFYLSKNMQHCNSILNKILKCSDNKSSSTDLKTLAIINGFQGFMNNDYIECEEFYSKSLGFNGLSFGEPRGYLNKGHGFNGISGWKVARKAFVLREFKVADYLNEMFLCQQYNFMEKESKKAQIFLFSNRYNYIKSQGKNKEILIKINKELFPDVNSKETKKPLKLSTSLRESNGINYGEIDEHPNQYHKINLFDESTYYLSESNYLPELINAEIMNKIDFPSINDPSEISTNHFFSKNFIIFSIQQIINILKNNEGYNINQEYIQFFRLESLFSPSEVQRGNKKGTVFSGVGYTQLLNKGSFTNNLPEGSVISFGNNTHCESIHEKKLNVVYSPMYVYQLKNVKVDLIYSGWEHNIIIDTDKNAYASGHNNKMQGGITNTNKERDVIEIPTRIKNKNMEKTSFKMAGCGNEHSGFLTEKGEVYGVGSNSDGQLGSNDTKIVTSNGSKINFPDKADIVNIKCGSLHNLALSKTGLVYSWGSAQGGQGGLPESDLLKVNNNKNHLFIGEPVAISGLGNDIINFSAGEVHNLASDKNGKCYSWGLGSNGQLGGGFCEDSFEPGTGGFKSRMLTPMVCCEDTNNKISIVQCGKTFSTFINERCELFGFGINDLYQLGISEPPNHAHLLDQGGECYDYVYPTKIEYFDNMKVLLISCGEGHCCAGVESNGCRNVWTWGNNRFGQCGGGRDVKSSLPKPMQLPFGHNNLNVKGITCGAFYTLGGIGSLEANIKERREQYLEGIIKQSNLKL